MILSLLLLFILLLCFLIGSIPSGYWITWKIKGTDIRQYGSGNIGATNVYRVLGLKMAVLVALADIVKGIGAVVAASLVTAEPFYLLLGGLITILGHNYSIFLGFKGGRGVATTCGVLLALLAKPVLLALLFWVILVIVTRYVSVASILASIFLLPLVFFMGYPLYYFFFVLLLVIFIIYRHMENIHRLLRGEENRLPWPPQGKKGRVK